MFYQFTPSHTVLRPTQSWLKLGKASHLEALIRLFKGHNNCRCATWSISKFIPCIDTVSSDIFQTLVVSKQTVLTKSRRPHSPLQEGVRAVALSIYSHKQTQNKAQRSAACGHVSESSQSLRFILSLRMNSSFIPSKFFCIFFLIFFQYLGRIR